jgi:Icc-related predicted phosphoesterase
MSTPFIIAIGDLHFPFHDAARLRQVLDAVKSLHPDIVVQMGDLYDMYSFAKFPRTHNLMTPKDEVLRGRAQAETFWETIRKSVPQAELYQIKGNHDSRPLARVADKFPEVEALLNIEALWQFPGVNTQVDEREELIINDIVFMHGFRQHGHHARHNRKSTVCGHLHRGGVHYERLGDKIIWELNAGHVADVTSAPLSYTKQRKFSHWTAGYGVIDALGPRFVPL